MECTQCLSILRILSIARLFAEQEQFWAVCHFHSVYLQRNHLSVLLVSSHALWCGNCQAGNRWTYKLRVCVCACTHVRAHEGRGVWGTKEGTSEKQRPNLCLLHGWASWQCPQSPEDDQFPVLRVETLFRRRAEAHWSVVVMLRFFPWPPSAFSTKCHRTPNHAFQLQQGNCQELLCMTVWISVLSMAQRAE